MRRWVFFLGVLVFVAATCVYAGAGALPTTTVAAVGTDVGLQWSGPPAINDGFTVNAVSCVSPTFCMAIGNWSAGGDGTDVTTFDGNSWSQPSSALTTDGLTSLSCTSETFCMASGYGGNYLTFDGSTWSGSNPILPPPSLPLNGTTSVSCASPLLCVATSIVEGTVYTYNGSTWSLVPSVKGTTGENSVSCAGPSLCAVAGGGFLATFDGNTWTSDPVSADTVSCGSATLCAAVNIGNDMQVFDGSGWTDDGVIDPGNPIIDVSCSGTSYCAAVDQSGNVVQYNGTSWTIGPVVESRSYGAAPALEHISCTSSTFCVVIDEDQNVFYNNGGTWTSNDTTTYDGNDPQFSCASPTFCVGADTAGEAVTLNATTWSGPSPLALGAWGNVSCAPNSNFCMEVDGSDYGLIYDGQSWTASSALSGAGIFLISCPTAGSCVGMGDRNTYLYSGGSWTESGATTSDDPITLSCASMSFCGATDENGGLFTFDGSSWSEQTGVLPTHPETNYASSVSCPSVGFCMAVDTFGEAASYQDGSWSVTPIGAEEDGFPQALSSVSCATATFCVAISAGGTTVVYENSQWSQIAPMGSDIFGLDSGHSISCPTTSFCVGMDGAGIVQYLYPDATTTSGGATVDSASVDQTVTYSATVSAPASDVVAGPTGQIDFAVGSASLCTATIAGDTATCTSSAAPRGQDTVSAQYSGDIYHAASAATSQLLVGSAVAPPTVTIVTPAEGAVYGVGTAVHADYSCQAASGTTLSSCHGPVTSGAAIATAAADVGIHQFSVEGQDSDGQSTTAATTYAVVSAPVISSFSPPTGKVGSVITISGTGLGSATAVIIGRKQLPIVTDTATTITATVPPGAKSGVIKVTTPGGTARSAGKFKVKR